MRSQHTNPACRLNDNTPVSLLCLLLVLFLLQGCEHLTNAKKPVNQALVSNTERSWFRPAKLELWKEAMTNFTKQDQAQKPAKCATLFIGSSSIRLWQNIASHFPGREVINRGFGGSTIDDINVNFATVAAPYQPSHIVFYAGENDISFRLPPDEAFEDFLQFMTLKSASLGDTPVLFISVKPSKRRFDQVYQQMALNNKIKNYAKTRNDLIYVDVFTPMLTPTGEPKDIFIEDKLHMNQQGYAIWAKAINAALDQKKPSSTFHCSQ